MPITRDARAGTDDPTLLDLTVIAIYERLWLWRHRVPGRGLTVEAAAAKLGIDPYVLTKLETGGRVLVDAEIVNRVQLAIEPLEPTIGELCFLARRRSGKQLTELTELLSVSRVWFLRMEREGDQRVIELWKSLGFNFPSLLTPTDAV